MTNHQSLWWCHVSSLTSDPGHRNDLPLHHVIDVEELVLHACRHHLLAVCTETSFIDREVLQVDTLDLWVGLPIHLRGEETEQKLLTCTCTANTRLADDDHSLMLSNVCEAMRLQFSISPLESTAYLEEGDCVIEAGSEDDLRGRVELHRGQAPLTWVSVVSIQTFLYLERETGHAVWAQDDKMTSSKSTSQSDTGMERLQQVDNWCMYFPRHTL